MNKYETIFIINPNIESEAVENAVESLQNLITDGKGEILKMEKWGKKRLAYEVKGNKDGYYVLMNFMADPMFIERLGRYCRVTEDIIKYITVRAEDLPEVKREPRKIEIRDEEDEFDDEFDFDYEDNDEERRNF